MRSTTSMPVRNDMDYTEMVLRIHPNIMAEHGESYMTLSVAVQDVLLTHYQIDDCHKVNMVCANLWSNVPQTESLKLIHPKRG